MCPNHRGKLWTSSLLLVASKLLLALHVPEPGEQIVDKLTIACSPSKSAGYICIDVF